MSPQQVLLRNLRALDGSDPYKCHLATGTTRIFNSLIDMRSPEAPATNLIAIINGYTNNGVSLDLPTTSLSHHNGRFMKVWRMARAFWANPLQRGHGQEKSTLHCLHYDSITLLIETVVPPGVDSAPTAAYTFSPTHCPNLPTVSGKATRHCPAGQSLTKVR